MANNTHLFHPIQNTWNTGSCILNMLLEHWYYTACAIVLLGPHGFVIPGKGSGMLWTKGFYRCPLWQSADGKQDYRAGCFRWTTWQVRVSSSIPQRLPAPGSDNQHCSKVNGSLWLIERKTIPVTMQGLGFIVLAT